MNLSDILLALLAVSAGAGLPIQFAINTQLAKVLGSPLAASVVSFAAGLVILLALSAAFVRTLPTASALRGAPHYFFYVGGACGALMVSAAIIVTPRLGAAAMSTFAILGQVVAATVIDRFGLLGIAAREATPGRLIGAFLVVVGAVMVRTL